MPGRFLALTLKGLRYRPVRSWLTILGIIIGIMLVVIILALGSGIQNTVRKTLQMFGANVIMVMPGKETNPLLGFFGGQRFREKDLFELQNIAGVKFVVPMEYGTVNVEYRGEKKSAMLHAANWENYIQILEMSQGVKLAKGRWPQNDQFKEVVIGNKAVNNLFKRKVVVGNDIIIKGKRFKVVGSLSEIGEQMADNVIYLSMNLFREVMVSKTGAGSAFIKLEPSADINLAAQQIKFQLSKQDVVRDFSVLTPDKADRLVGNVLTIVELVLIAIALISLMVGAVGIMNTMYTSVLERVKQIGIMKAIGASRDHILSLFLIESGMIGLVGGILGVVLGIAAAFVVGIIAAQFGVRGLFSFSSLDFLGFFVILIITFITGVLSGILPARQAASMEPAEALRYE